MARTSANAGAPEQIEIRTEDGVALRADVREPPKKKLIGVCVLSHAMFARKSEFERPHGDGLARFFALRGWRTIAFDFRGHGESGVAASAGGTWTYDDLVQRDMPAVVRSARARAKRLPVIVVGHSLGGHVALASQGIGALDADAIVLAAANVWVRALEPSRARWAIKRATLAAILAVCKRRGYFPARALRLGSDDESAAYFVAFERYARTGTWGTDDGRVDYLAAVHNVVAPVLAIASDGDLLNCHPACAELLLARVSGPARFEHVRRGNDGGRAPGHMELVTSLRARREWESALAWLEQTIKRR
jgi:predicted alpha/beta hydrolase